MSYLIEFPQRNVIKNKVGSDKKKSTLALLEIIVSLMSKSCVDLSQFLTNFSLSHSEIVHIKSWNLIWFQSILAFTLCLLPLIRLLTCCHFLTLFSLSNFQRRTHWETLNGYKLSTWRQTEKDEVRPWVAMAPRNFTTSKGQDNSGIKTK